MKNIWFTADHHFGHANIIKYCNRPFASVVEMDNVLIQRWNADVKVNDTVYYLGDFTMGNGSDAILYGSTLNGSIIFLAGNHDKWLSRSTPSMAEVIINKQLFVLNHYSMRSWNKSHRGSFHLYGHTHGTLPGLGRSMDVGVDTNDFKLYHIDEIVDKLSKITPHDAV